jgi:uncharacterized protein (TIGR02246 family)
MVDNARLAGLTAERKPGGSRKKGRLMRAPSVLLPGVLAITLVACSSGPTAEEFGKTDVDEINKLIQEFIKVYNEKDAGKVARLFAGSGVVLPPNASAVRGIDAIQQYYVARFGQGASDLELEPRDITGSGVLGVANGDYRLNMAPPGEEVRRDRGKFLFVLRDNNGKWLLEYLMFSSDFAASPTGG